MTEQSFIFIKIFPRHKIKAGNRISYSMLELKNVSKFFTSKGLIFSTGKTFAAVDNLSLKIDKGVSLGIVGASGSGKSTVAKLLADIYKADAGEVLYHGKNIATLGKEYKKYRKSVQVVFQDPNNSLNPKLKIREILADGLKANFSLTKQELYDKIKAVLDLVQLPDGYLDRYAHQLSGGQRQRISIARAVLLEPEVIIADEPLSMLDVSVQAQILNLFNKLIDNGLTLIMISHNLAHVYHIAEKVIVMKNGKIVEEGKTSLIIKEPQNEYTKELIGIKKYDKVI